MPELTLDQALAELPDTADGIADRMRAMEIKGIQRDTRRCALAVYLRRKGVRRPVVAVDSVANFGIDMADLSAAAVTFRERFDAGVYLDLVAVPSV